MCMECALVVAACVGGGVAATKLAVVRIRALHARKVQKPKKAKPPA